jgi:uncharacterized protein YwgA
MKPEPFRWLAGVIAAHPDRRVVGRTRLQKTVKLLQRKGLPTDLSFSIHFYGPYSEGLNSTLGLLQGLGLVKEELRHGSGEQQYYVYTASEEAVLPGMDDFRPWLDVIHEAGDVPLELAATYDAFREMGCDHAEALERLRQKKGAKCGAGNEAAALEVLRKLGLPTGLEAGTTAG